jgi:excisionase family DNA binding protein
LKKILTAKELAGYLRFHEITIYKLANEGKIPATRIGRSWRFDKEAVDKWLIRGGQGEPQTGKKSKTKTTRKTGKRQLPKKPKRRRK